MKEVHLKIFDKSFLSPVTITFFIVSEEKDSNDIPIFREFFTFNCDYIFNAEYKNVYKNVKQTLKEIKCQLDRYFDLWVSEYKNEYTFLNKYELNNTMFKNNKNYFSLILNTVFNNE
jgi:hypothetical protein